MVIHIGSIDLEVDNNYIDSLNIVVENKIGDTYFLYLDDGTQFSCHENFWIIYKRDRKINSIIH